MLNIVKGIFGFDPMDLVQGLKQKNPLEGGMMPDLVPKMQIGEGGLRNLEAAGMAQDLTADELAMARRDFQELGIDQFSRTDWRDRGVEIDVNADKAMYEIPDDEVRLLKGKDPEKIKGDIGFSELFKADLLENAYPEISDIKLRFIDDPKSDKAGGYDPVQNILLVNRKHPYVQETGLKKVVLHEIQHFVQAKEGMTFGENLALRLSEEPDYVMGAEALKKSLDSNMVRADLAKMLTDNPKLNFNATNVQLAIKALADNPTADHKLVLAEAFGSKDMAEKFISKAGAYPALRGIIESKELAEDGYRAAFKKYTSVAGEAFANATMNRGDKNLAQLRADKVQNELARQGLAVDELLPSSFERQYAANLQNVKYADPMASSIQSSIPQGL